MQALQSLGVNWPFFISQIVNFAILFYLLKRFLYEPILEMLEKRRSEIEKSLNEAKRITEEGKEFDAKRVEMLEASKKEARSLIEDAIITSEKIKDDIIKEAEEKTKEMVAYAGAQAEEEKKKIMAEVKGEILVLAKEAAEKIFQENISSEEERRYIERTMK